MALSVRDSVKCRDVITSEWYQQTFRPEWKLKDDQNEKSYYFNTAGGLRQSLSVTGKGTGFRGDALIVDDAHNVKEYPSDGDLAGVQFWWDKRMSSRLNDRKRAVRICVMQRVHENDLSGHILKKGNYVHLCLPTLFDPERRCETAWGRDPRMRTDELLFPALFPKDVVDEDKEDLGEYEFAAQHQQQPAPPGGGVVKQQWFKFWYPADVPVPQRYMTKLDDGSQFLHEQVPMPEDLSLVQSWDMTFKDTSNAKTRAKKKVDFVVGQAWGILKLKRYLVHQLRDRWSFTDTVDAVRQMCKLYPRASLKFVEDAANGPAVMNQLKQEIGGFEPVTPMGGKVARAHSASHVIRAGYVYLPHPDLFPWVKGFLHEVCTFPHSANDDQVDAMTQLINQLRGETTYDFNKVEPSKPLPMGQAKAGKDPSWPEDGSEYSDDDLDNPSRVTRGRRMW
jgi:predicted phage terminase large subunit-like protein